MGKRKIRFLIILTVCLGAVAGGFFLDISLGLALLALAIPAAYMAYKPMIPTPAPMWFLYNNHIKPKLCKKAAPSPKDGPGGYREPEYGTFEADFYIAAEGSDENDGSADAPFATFERARQAVRGLDKTRKTAVTVAVQAGKYPVEQVRFGPEDSGSRDCPVIYKAHGGAVVLDGGVDLSARDFSPVTQEAVLERLTPEAREKVRVADLKALGLTREQIGAIHVFGAFHLADQYDGDWIGAAHCELFANGKRQTLARYPNGEQWLELDRPVCFVGGSESEQTGVFDPQFRARRNPEGDVYAVNEALARRIASWKTLEDVWMYGFWMYDWADSATPVADFDPVKGTLTPKFVSQWGARKGAPYYFFNVLEELDAPGEWYLDRKERKLYFYPEGELTDVQLSVSTQCILKVENAEYLTFDGFTLQGTRANAAEITGEHITVKNCRIRNCAGEGIVVKGSHNRISNNHITQVGRGGVCVDGGDRNTLTPGENVVEKNKIHSWSRIYRTYCPAVLLQGVGNRCRYNEMYDSPHEVIWYHGNDHTIEYNHIHHACLLTKDGGAIYAGKQWSYYGSVIRGNVIHDLGTEYYTASAIYMDDGMSGQTICDNVMVNIPGIAIQLGGGRDLVVKDNVIVNCTNTPISYDNRAIEGALHGTWFHYCSEPGGFMWKLLWESPYRSRVWQEAYPQMAAFSEDFADHKNPFFVPNPGCSQVTDNWIFDQAPIRGNILCKEAKKYGRIQNNRILPMKKCRDYFAAPEKGDYTPKKCLEGSR